MLWELLIPAGVGLLFTIVGARAVGKARWLFRHGARAEGIVVGQRSSSGESGLTYAPRVEFTTADGHRVQVTSSTSMSHSSFVPGRRVTVHYDPQRPTKAVIKGYDGRLDWIFVGIGVPLFAIPAAIFLLDAAGVTLDGSFYGPVAMIGAPILIGGIFLAVGVVGVGSVLRIRSGPRATGVVVGETTSSSNNGLTLHHPVVRWTTPDGWEIEAPSVRGRVFRRHKVGQRVRIHQHPDDPRRMLLRGDGPAPVFVIFLFVGLLVLLIGTLIAGFVVLPG